MALHHKIQAHHHVSIWAVAVLSVLAMSATYSNSLVASADDSSVTATVEPHTTATPSPKGETTTPSSPAKKLFSGDDTKDKPVTTKPTACVQDQANQTERAAKVQQQTALLQQINTLKQQESGLSGDSPDEQALKERETSLQAQADALKIQIGDHPETAPTGPSGDCRKAIIAQQKGYMEKFSAKIPKIKSTFAKVDDATTKIKAELPALKEAGVDQVTLDKLTKDITTINTDSATLKTFFDDMQNRISTFLADSSNSPDAAFQGMKVDTSTQKKSADAANELVTTFTDMQTILNQITQ